MVVLYGLGTTIGAGIYALVGEIAKAAGYFAPVSFIIASILAGFTAISFAELSGRYPFAAGAALYIHNGFKSQRLSILTGLLVILAGLVSSAALINGFVSYLHQFIGVDRVLAISLVALLLFIIAAWGIAESVAIACFITLIEIGGLLLIIFVSKESLSHLPSRWTALIPPSNFTSWGGIYLGAVISFYAFIGFEDMVDIAEEIKDVKRNLPRAILLTLGITTVLYVSLMITAILSLPPAELASQAAPLSFLYEYHTGEKAVVISVIGMFAIINGALIQIIMASRVMYGLSSRGHLPKLLGVIYSRTRTPVIATAMAVIIVLALALIGRLGSLATITSFLMLTVFAFVNLALWRIKQQDPNPAGVIIFPRWIPIVGFFVSTAFLLGKVFSYA